MYYVLGTGYNCNRMPKTTVHKEEVYKDFQKQISDMNYYSCKAEVEVVGNKSPHNYVLIHTYKNR